MVSWEQFLLWRRQMFPYVYPSESYTTWVKGQDPRYTSSFSRFSVSRYALSLYTEWNRHSNIISFPFFISYICKQCNSDFSKLICALILSYKTAGKIFWNNIWVHKEKCWSLGKTWQQKAGAIIVVLTRRQIPEDTGLHIPLFYKSTRPKMW